MVDNPTMSVITMNISGLNAQIKRHCQSVSRNKTQLYVVYKKKHFNVSSHKD